MRTGPSEQCFARWDLGVGQQAYVMGVDDTDSDAFVASEGATLGTNNWLRVVAAQVKLGDSAIAGRTLQLEAQQKREFFGPGGAVVNDRLWKTQHDEVSTTDATTTTVLTFTPNASTRGAAFVYVSSNDTTNNEAGAFFAMVQWTKGGTTSGTLTQLHKVGAASSGSLGIATGSATVIITVTGVAASNITWECETKWNEIAGA